MKALKVPKKEAEKAKNELSRQGLLDPERVPETEKGYVYFPIRDDLETEYEVVDKELEEKETDTGYREALAEKLSEEEMGLVKTSQDIIGDIAIIEVDESLEEKERLLGETLLEAKPYLATVLKKGKHEGEFRTQELEWLAGEERKETTHRESNCRFKLDVEKVYFSPRLATERERVASLVRPGEKVLVMFSGCAPYPCVIAKNTEARKVIGVEINPVAHEYGLENVEMNKLHNVELVQGDVGGIVPGLDEVFDRVVMPGPDNASEYLEEALGKVNEGGFIHYYDFIDEEDIPEELEHNLKQAARKARREFEIINVEKCGSVSPGRYRVCADVKVN